MSLLINLRHLDARNLSLEGQLPVAELDIDVGDEVIKLAGPLGYTLEVQKLEDGVLVQGRVSLPLECQCVRCLKPFEFRLQLDSWTCHLPIRGEDAVKIVNDCVDLTPWVREDILLEFPQHPLCEPNCRGLRSASVGKSMVHSSNGPSEQGSSAWKELNKLKF